MSQQVNLYQPIFRKQPQVFSSATLVKIMLLLIAGFGAIYGFGHFQLAKLEARVADLERQRDNAAAQLAQVTERQAPARRSALLDDQLRQVRRELEQKQRVIGALERRDGARSAGFSEYFAGLGRQRLNGLWLTRIAVHEDGRIELHGYTEQAQLVPRYLQRLSKEPAFRGTEFRSIGIQRTEAPTYNAFQVSTSREDDA